MNFEKLIFIDLETTGANPAVDRITEIGLVEVDWEGDAIRWSSLVNPGVSIPTFIQGLTGISNEMVRQAPSFEQLAPALHQRLQGALFIAHNARFDYGFLRNAFSTAGEETIAAAVVATLLKLTGLFKSFEVIAAEFKGDEKSTATGEAVVFA